MTWHEESGVKASKVKFMESFMSKFIVADLRVYGTENLLFDYGPQRIYMIKGKVSTNEL